MHNKNAKIIAVVVIGLLVIAGLFAYRYSGKLKGLFGRADEQIDLSWGNSTSQSPTDLACPSFVDPNGVNILDASGTVTNYGPGVAGAVTVAVFPQYGTGPTPGFPPDSQITVSSGTYSNGSWTIGDLAAGAAATITFHVPIPDDGFNLEAEVSGTGDDVDSAPGNRDSAEEDDNLKIGCQPANLPYATPAGGNGFDLAVAKSANPVTLPVGQNTTFTVTLTNLTLTPATGVTLKDTLPSTVSYVSHSTAAGTYTAATGVWNIGNVAAQGSVTLNIVAKVNSAGVHTNIAQLTASTPLDTNPINNAASASVSTTGPPPFDGDLVCSPATQTVAINQNANFTVLNGEPANSTWSAPGGTPATGSGATFTTKYATAGDKTVTVSFQNSTGVCRVTVTPTYATPYETPYATPVSTNIDLSLTKSVNNNQPQLNANVVFTVTVSNAGPANATGVTVKDILPSGLTFVSAIASKGTYASATGIWTVGSMSSGSSANIQITAKATQVGSITNTAEVCAADQTDVDSTPCNNVPSEDDQASASITVSAIQTTQKADLSLDKSVSDAAPDVGSDVIYSIVVTNIGPDDATGVTVKDVLPAGLTYKSNTPSKGTYSNITGIWTVGSLNVGASASLLITVTVNQTGTITNTAEVCSSSLPDPDSTPCNNVPTEDDQDSVPITPPSTPYATPDTYSTPYSSPYATPGGGYSTPYGTPYSSPSGGSSPRIDLSLTKAVSNSSPLQNEQIVYTVSVSNRGPNNATGVTVKDILPVGTVFVKATASVGSYSKTTGIWTIGNLAKGAAASLQLTVRVDRVATVINIAEVCSASPNDTDSTPCNNDPNEDDYGTATFTTRPGQVLPAAGSSQALPVAVGFGSILLASIIYFADRTRKMQKRFGDVLVNSTVKD